MVARYPNHGRIIVEGDAALECAKEALQRLDVLRAGLRSETKVRFFEYYVILAMCMS